MSVRAGGQELVEAWLAGACSATAAWSAGRVGTCDAGIVRVDLLAGAAVAAAAGNGWTTDAMGSPTAGATRWAFRSYAAWLGPTPDAATELTNMPPISAKRANRSIYSTITMAATFPNGEVLVVEPFRSLKSLIVISGRGKAAVVRRGGAGGRPGRRAGTGRQLR